MRKLPNSAVSEIKVAMSKYARRLPKIGILIVMMIQASCANLYKIDTIKDNSVDTITALIQSDKQFIVHFKDTTFMLINTSISDNTLKGKLLLLNQIQRNYIHPQSRNKNRYTKPDENEVLNEAHVYTAGIGISDTANFSLPVSSILSIDVNQKNVEATKRSNLVGGLIITTTILGSLVGLGSYAVAHMFDSLKVW